MRILELGSGLSVAMAGMILAEQGHHVTKWPSPTDPMPTWRNGQALWEHYHSAKIIASSAETDVAKLIPGTFQGILDNYPATHWEALKVDRWREAQRLGIPWVALEDDGGGVQADALAQARAWMDIAPYIPFLIGDTAAGLWMAFKLLAVDRKPGLYRIGQASALAKLIEGELAVPRPRLTDRPGWQTTLYGPWWDDERIVGVEIQTEHGLMREPIRSREWKLRQLRHKGGRIRV